MRICPQCGTRFEESLQFCPHDGSPTYEAQDPPRADEDPLLGRVVDGRYRVEKRIGEGGMGVVYLATHTVLQKKLALKVLRGDGSKDAETVQRFMQEAQAATSIGHQNIIDISDFGRLADGSVYFVMEYLDGTSLSDMIKTGGSVPMQSAVHIIRQIGSALDAAHARGIVHRDLKPDNIFVIKQGSDPQFVKVLDFGVAKVGGAASKLTKTGMVFGTPHYMSPEQAAGHSVDQRTDIYALGVIMYEMFTGKVPFDADTFMGILSKHMFEAPVPPTDVHGASLGALEGVILRALEKNPDQRYQSMTELAEDLDTIAAGGTVEAVRHGVAPPPGGLADALEPPSYAEVAAANAPASGGRGALYVVLALVALLIVGVAVGTSVFLLTAEDDGLAQADDGGDDPTDDPAGPGTTDTLTGEAQPTNTLGPGTDPGTTGTVGSGGVDPSQADPSQADPSQVDPSQVDPSQAPTVDPTPAPVMVSITSDPAGAEVLLDGVMVGNTPVQLPRPATATQTVTLRYRGYEASDVQISPRTGEQLNVSLTRVSHSSRRRRSPDVVMPPVVHTQPPTTTTTTTRRRSTSEVVDPWAN